MHKTSIFDNFSPVSAKEWKQKIQFELKGEDYNDTLVWESPEGIKVKPFYNIEDKVKNEENINPKWCIAQCIYVNSTENANEKAKKELERGAESIYFIIPSEAINIEVLLKNIDLTRTSIYLNIHFLSEKYIRSILSFTKGSENIYLNLDPIGHLTRTGNWFHSWKSDFNIVQNLLNNNKASNVLSVDIGLYQGAGANMVQQLAYGLAHVNEYLNAFVNKSKTEFIICFNVAVGSNYFFEIAKLKALRLLWKTLSAEYNIKTPCHIITIPTSRNKTLYNFNMARCFNIVFGT